MNKIIIGAGLYGLYSALFCARRGENVVVLEYEDAAFTRATYINQARVHMGYHYPRSYSTAIKSSGYFDRFNEEFGFCIHKEFRKVYATSSKFSWTNAEQFEEFCKATKIRCSRIETSNYFKPEMCDGAFIVNEYTYDAQILKEHFLEELSGYKNAKIVYHARIDKIIEQGKEYEVTMEDGTVYRAPFVLNATYASTNQVIGKVVGEKIRPFDIKYELCEIILCEVNESLKDVGITVMDGPFFSIMPFGKTGLHSLTSVTFTPHRVSFDKTPTFACQDRCMGHCSIRQLGNCNSCEAKPKSAFDYMSNLAKKYLKDEFGFTYHSSLFSMKPILVDSEIDDSRPTVIRVHTKSPTFVSVLSGKINTVYDLDDILTTGGE